MITEFPPDELMNLPLEDLTQFIIENGKNHFRKPENVIQTLKKAARESYRVRPPLPSFTDLILEIILQTIRDLPRNPQGG